MSVAWNGECVRVEVADNSLRLPQHGNDHEPEQRGRGLYLVRELAWDLGYYPAAPGKVVWFEFSAHTAPILRPRSVPAWRPWSASHTPASHLA